MVDTSDNMLKVILLVGQIVKLNMVKDIYIGV